MLAIRMQRTGRKGHAMFRVIVQEAHLTPTSGKLVAQLGSYDPHTKVASLDKEKAGFYLKNGAQPSERAAKLLQSEGVKLPDWVHINTSKQSSLRHPEKLRSNQPKAEAPAEEAPAEAEEPAAAAEAATTDETPAESESSES